MYLNRFFYLISLAVAAAYFACCGGWLAAYLALVILIAPVVSVLCTLPLLPRYAERGPEMPARIDCLQGETVQIPLILPQESGLYLCCCVRAAVSDCMSGRIRKKNLIAEPGQTPTLTVDTSHCGIVECRILRCRVCDWLGLFRLPMKKPDGCLVVIAPTPKKPDPEPDFSVFRQSGFRPGTGGGAELHELRLYRPGDPVSSIHWKLSAKRDEPIIREPQEPAAPAAEAVLETPSDRDTLDRILGEALWTGLELTERGIPFRIGWRGLLSRSVADEASLEETMEALLRTRIRSFPTPDGKTEAMPGRIILTGGKGGGGEA